MKLLKGSSDVDTDKKNYWKGQWEIKLYSKDVDLVEWRPFDQYMHLNLTTRIWLTIPYFYFLICLLLVEVETLG